MGVDVGTPGTDSDISRTSELQELESPHSKFNWSATDNVESGMKGRSNEDERTLSKSLSFGLILKKVCIFLQVGLSIPFDSLAH